MVARAGRAMHLTMLPVGAQLHPHGSQVKQFKVAVDGGHARHVAARVYHHGHGLSQRAHAQVQVVLQRWRPAG